MSIELVDKIHERLREEIDSSGFSLAAAAREAGESSAQRLKDVVSGRQRCPADLVARLAVINVDVNYVLTGERSNRATSHDLPPDEQILLEAYRSMPATSRRALLAELLMGGKAKPKPKKASASSTSTVTGDGNSVVFGDYVKTK